MGSFEHLFWYSFTVLIVLHGTVTSGVLNQDKKKKKKTRTRRLSLTSGKYITGSFAPAGPNTIWKKRMEKENYETKTYQALMGEALKDVVPKFYREVEYNGECILFCQNVCLGITMRFRCCVCACVCVGVGAVSYTHLRAHETA